MRQFMNEYADSAEEEEHNVAPHTPENVLVARQRSSPNRCVNAEALATACDENLQIELGNNTRFPHYRQDTSA